MQKVRIMFLRIFKYVKILYKIWSNSTFSNVEIAKLVRFNYDQEQVREERSTGLEIEEQPNASSAPISSLIPLPIRSENSQKEQFDKALPDLDNLPPPSVNPFSAEMDVDPAPNNTTLVEIKGTPVESKCIFGVEF